MEIKVGEYVRTYNGNIFKIISGNSDDYDIDIEYHKLENTEEDWLESNRDNENGYFFDERHIKKHSPYIIDLIEPGDVIKYKEMFETKANEPHILNLRNQKEVDKFKKCVEDKEIAYISVVTKEQFTGMEYEV